MPPDMIANPVVETYKVSQGHFVNLASDGFWDQLTSSDHAVYCVRL